jgi:hypothetical protein
METTYKFKLPFCVGPSGIKADMIAALTDDEVDIEIRERQKVINTLIGDLYPGIILDEIYEISRLNQHRRQAKYLEQQR